MGLIEVPKILSQGENLQWMENVVSNFASSFITPLYFKIVLLYSEVTTHNVWDLSSLAVGLSVFIVSLFCFLLLDWTLLTVK